MIAGFVFIKCELGQVETVANQIVEIDGVSEIYSISGNVRPTGESLCQPLRRVRHRRAAMDPSYLGYSGDLDADRF